MNRYRLPPEREIMQDLVGFQINDILQASVYPQIAKHGDTEKSVSEIVDVFTDIVKDFARTYDPLITEQLLIRIPLFMKIVVKEPNIFKEVLEKWEKWVSESSK